MVTGELLGFTKAVYLFMSCLSLLPCTDQIKKLKCIYQNILYLTSVFILKVNLSNVFFKYQIKF